MAAATHVEVPAEALDLRESISLEDNLTLTEALSSRWQPAEPGSVFDAQGRVPIHIIRPGVGKGKGRHLYEANMLARDAHVFKGWKMYVDHESPEAKKAKGGLPRSLRDSGGIVKEAFWDPDVPADPARGYGQGAVVGLVKPTRLVREFIEDDPEIVEASIAASATGVKPVIRDGQRVWLVEGINDRGSVDWVTEAGAGGRVVALMEAVMEDSDSDLYESIDAMDDAEFRDWLSEVRPNLQLAEAGSEPNPEGGDVDITPEALAEALSANPSVLAEALQKSPEAQDFMRSLAEATVEEERELIRAEAQAEAQRAIQLRDMRDEAHKVIAESKLPESWQKGLKARFDLVEGAPTDALDVADEVDGDGNVTKPAIESLREALTTEIDAERERLREARPTTVRGQGPSGPDAGGSEGGKVKPSETSWGKFLQESANVDIDKAYPIVGAGESA
jgi:hypothetical protein